MKKGPLSGFGARAPEELERLGASVRRIIDAMLRIDDARDALVAAADRLDEVAGSLERVARRSDTLRFGRPGEPEDARPYYVDGVMLPGYHPLASDHQIATHDGITRGRVRFGVAFEGPPGCAHGGHVASFFDQILGSHTLGLGLPAMTASLSLQYRRPTPLFTELAFEVRIQRVSGRKIDVVADLRAAHADEPFVEAEALFVLPSGAATEALRGLVRPRGG